ncbi:hypothetical protein ACE1CI_03820 [Aerosakkonemataceae cyanobacterium BLCC-F50]|uniref:Uncharacterized protein n=1 Tax=Floridaenema flaviceps BLCC-F50 TaxID=3153642 RepID=A0ABV4XK30_9CYAN
MIFTYQLGKTILTTKLKNYFTSLQELRNFNLSGVKALLEDTLQRYAPIKHLFLIFPINFCRLNILVDNPKLQIDRITS